MAYITGFSGKLPSSDSLREFWNNLCTGKDLVSTTERYPADYHGLPGSKYTVVYLVYIYITVYNVI